MLSVLILFLIPVGGGIAPGVLLAHGRGIPWPVTTGLYLVSDVILALAFEPVLRLMIKAGRGVPRFERAATAFRLALDRMTAAYGGAGAGPFALILFSFSAEPMSGRAATAAAGHGPVSGWALSIAGDMLYFLLIMASTLKLNSLLGDPVLTLAAVFALMIALPPLARRLRPVFSPGRAP